MNRTKNNTPFTLWVRTSVSWKQMFLEKCFVTLMADFFIQLMLTVVLAASELFLLFCKLWPVFYISYGTVADWPKQF